MELTRSRIVLAGLLLAFAAHGVSAAPSESLRFTPSGSGEFAFDTGTLRGTLRSGGKSKGFSSVTHVPSGARLDSSMGLLSHYRVFTANQRYGNGAWDWPSTAEALPDGSVRVIWPAAADRPFELRAVYRLPAPNTLEVETSVEARTNLAGFEAFVACYFEKSFTNSQVLARSSATKPPGFVTADPQSGVWLAFPRDDAAVKLIRDGRWTLPPNPVDWAIQPPLAKPLGLRRAPHNGVTALLMSPPEDAFACFTPHQLETHYSMYFGLFGKDLAPGQTASARAGLVLGTNITDEEALRLCERWNAQAKATR